MCIPSPDTGAGVEVTVTSATHKIEILSTFILGYLLTIHYRDNC